MRNYFILMVLGIVLFQVGCQKDVFEDGEHTNVKFSESENNFFNLNYDFQTKSRNLKNTDKSNFIFDKNLINLYNQIIIENRKEKFIDSFVIKYGVPYWKKAQIFKNINEYSVAILLPITDGIKTSGVITAIKSGNDNLFKIQFNSREYLNNKIGCGEHFSQIKIIHMTDMLFKHIDQQYSEKYCNCVTNQDINLAVSNNSNNSQLDCEWQFLEVCEGDVVYAGGVSSFPPYLDHDNDGILNIDDQDWDDFSRRHGNITQEQLQQYFLGWWDEHFDDPWNYDEWTDEMRSADDQKLWDLWWDWMEKYGDDDNDGIKNYLDEDRDGNGQLDAHETDLPCPFGNNGDWYDDYPIKNETLESRSINCQYIYAKICNNDPRFWWEGDWFEVHDLDQKKNWLITQFINNNPFVLNYFTTVQIHEIANNCDVFDLQYDNCLMLALMEYYHNSLLQLDDYSDYVLNFSGQFYGNETYFNWFFNKYSAEKYFDAVKYYEEMLAKGVSIRWEDIMEGLSWEYDLGEEEEIQNNIQIQSITVPLAGIIPGIKVCETEYRHPHNPPTTIAPDMKSGTNANLALLSSDNSGLATLSTDQLRWYMYEHITWASSGTLEPEAQYFMERFITGDGTDYFSPIMSNAAKNKIATKNFIKKFGNDLNIELKKTNGNINSIPLIFYDKNEQDGHPKYDDSNLEGLRIMMNDTEYTKIHKQNYNYDPNTKEWEGTFYIEVFDHFGLDDEDLGKFQNATLPFTINKTPGRGFASWWLLQHHKGKKPFRTQMKFIVNIKGKI